MISIQSLYKSYGSLSVLQGIDVQLAPGTVHGIVGKNGAGKTTFFNCLYGLETYEGEIKYSGSNLREVCAYLPTAPYMMTHITGEEYLYLCSNAARVSPPDLEEKNIFALPLERYISSYSTGMQKKLALTGLLVRPNECYLLDEPFNGVDLESNLLIQALIARLKETGKTVIISSHILNALAVCCDHIYLLDEGKIEQRYEAPDFHGLEGELQSGQDSERIRNLEI